VWQDATLSGGQTPEDGFEFLRATQRTRASSTGAIHLESRAQNTALDVWLDAGAPVEWWRATAPGPPGKGEQRFHLARLHGRKGGMRSVWSWTGAVAGTDFGEDQVEVTLADGSRHVHARRDRGWHVDLLTGSARSSIDLGGWRDEPAAPVAAIGLYGDATTETSPRASTPLTLPRTFRLGEGHYRRSEESWRDAGAPTATVRVVWTGEELRIEADVAKTGDLVFVPADAVNRYDNEPADINGDGLQLYLRTSRGEGAWVCVPHGRDGTVRVRGIPGWGTLTAPRARWRKTERGYSVDLAIAMPEAPSGDSPRLVELDVIVNETVPDRERRRGQLVLSGAAGEFAYLAGDRHDPARLLPFVLES
jgi:hypothetical protein